MAAVRDTNPLAAWKACGLEDRTAVSGWAPRKRKLDRTIMCPLKNFGGVNQTSILLWPDSRALVRNVGTRLV